VESHRALEACGHRGAELLAQGARACRYSDRMPNSSFVQLKVRKLTQGPGETGVVADFGVRLNCLLQQEVGLIEVAESVRQPREQCQRVELAPLADRR
jgi:hypothetical protein